MSYRITIHILHEPENENGLQSKVYEQTVEVLDLGAVMAAVNRKPRKSRAKNAKDDQK